MAQTKRYVLPEHNQPIPRGAAMEAVWRNNDKESIICAILQITADDCRPRGEWIPGRELSIRTPDGKPIYEDYHCSVCGCVSESHIKPSAIFCPMCGANLTNHELRGEYNDGKK